MTVQPTFDAPSPLDVAAAHHRAGRHAHAERLCRQILSRDPDNVATMHRLGAILHDTRRSGEALAWLERAVALDPSQAEHHLRLGTVHQAIGHADRAADCYRQAILLDPALAPAYENLGLLLLRDNHVEEAAVCFEQHLRLRPRSAEARINLGLAQRRLGHLDEALALLTSAIALNPASPAGHQQLGAALSAAGRLDEAAESFRRSVDLTPLRPDGHVLFGASIKALGRIDEALARYHQALRLDPSCAEGHVELGMTRLLLDDFARGWEGYEWRHRLPAPPLAKLPSPQWDGSDPHGRTIVVHAEQGAGDMLQFVRYADVLKARGARVVLGCPARMVSILSSCAGLDAVLPHGSLIPPCDWHVPLMSLPRLVRTRLDTIPSAVPYLQAPPALIERWRADLSRAGGFRVAIHWQGSTSNGADYLRSVPLSVFEPIARVPGVRLISLQKNAGSDQVAMVADRFAVLDLADRLDISGHAFLDTAAVMMAVDLVITADSAVAHLAGALGVPVWIAVPYVPDWRWLLDREDCPWYPTARLFRQARPGVWPEVFERMAEALQATLESR